MKNPDEDEALNVGDDVLDDDLIEEGADWDGSESELVDDNDGQLACSEKVKMTRQAIEDWHEQRRIDRELDELLD